MYVCMHVETDSSGDSLVKRAGVYLDVIGRDDGPGRVQIELQIAADSFCIR